MKRVLFILLAIFAFESLASGQKTVYAPQQLIDVVYKVDGTTLRGTIVEQTPNVDYTLLTLDGHTIKIDALQIEKIVKEPLATATIVTENHNYNYNPYIVCKFDEEGNPIYCSEKLVTHEEEGSFKGSAFDSAVKAYYDTIYDTLVNGAPLVIKTENIAKLINIIEQVHAENPMPVKY